MAAMVPRASVADNQTTARLQNPLCGSARPVLTHPICDFILKAPAWVRDLGVWVWARPFEKFPAENLEWNPRFPRQSRQSDQIVSPRAEKFEDVGFMRPQPPRATHTSKQETCKFSSRLVSRPASISPDPPRARFGPRRARRRATPVRQISRQKRGQKRALGFVDKTRRRALLIASNAT